MLPSLPHVSRRDLSYFFFSQHFSDGLRTTLAILLPALVGAQWGDFAAGITISTGAVCVSATDTPGPARAPHTSSMVRAKASPTTSSPSSQR
ncbi:MAG: hypothetical protein EOO57_21845 [Hymenobacter sp.]|nr:MAG: hypothetical protein EOO57_21845 [Hymenobacter sp.]